MRIVVYGTGGVGGYFGARLQQAGHDVAFVARGAHLQALREHGLRLTSPLGDATLPDVVATDAPATLPPADVALVCVKTFQLPEALPGIEALAARGAFVVPLLNGVEAADQIAERLGRAAVVPGLCRIISRVAGPGHVVHLGAEPYLAFGEWDGRASERVSELLGVARSAAMTAEVPEDIWGALWRKLLFVVSVGGVGAVTRAPVGVSRTLPETRALLEAAMREIAAVARGRGVTLPEDAVEAALAFTDTLPPEGTASLQRDLAEGRPSELEAWNGAVVRLGREVGVATPVHDFIYASLLPLEQRACGALRFA